MTTTDGVVIGGRVVQLADATGPRSAQIVLGDPTVDAAVLETARGGMLRQGLGYDWSDVGVITNLVKDSNGHLRIALNSTALGPGNYQLTIEGLNWRGDPEPDSWVTIGIAR